MEMITILNMAIPVVYGLVAGALTGATVYFRQKMSSKNISFDLNKLTNTSIYGGIIGVVAVVQGVPLQAAADFVLGPLAPVLATIGLVHISQNTKRGLIEAVKKRNN